jgi:hypothetical protein
VKSAGGIHRASGALAPSSTTPTRRCYLLLSLGRRLLPIHNMMQRPLIAGIIKARWLSKTRLSSQRRMTHTRFSQIPGPGYNTGTLRLKTRRQCLCHGRQCPMLFTSEFWYLSIHIGCRGWYINFSSTSETNGLTRMSWRIVDINENFFAGERGRRFIMSVSTTFIS